MSDLEAAFERHRRELHVHCYRMLASYDDAEDAVQETYLRAWRARDGFDGEHPRAWLYRIATRVCLDRARARSRQAGAGTEVGWLTPYPDPLLDEVATGEAEPDDVYIARETIELAFLTALQVLPPRQRAALLAREVLGLPAADTARLLETSVAAANSALQRARETMRDHLPSHRVDWTAAAPNAEEKRLLAAFIDAHEQCDPRAALAAAASDVRVTMPPYPWRYDGLDALRPLLERAFGPGREGDWRLLPTGVNRMPAAASYLRRPGDSAFRAFKLDVLRVEGDRIAEITTFGPAPFPALGLPETLPGVQARGPGLRRCPPGPPRRT
ncbi:MAG TPA: RNA polymerase subunit sigma-70 [Nocardioides sp.]|jgi:RNA polymerase sigma-70 factor (ECF subfamily)|nr:RNA polymerase subunit sigma-70 [Nocardioides sp.]